MTGRETRINSDNIIVAQKLTTGRTLDIGCGDIDCIGDVTLDADPAADPDVLADLSDGIPFDTDSFDTVVALHVLEHMGDDVALWEEMQRVARERAVGMVPIGERDDPDHEHLYTGRSDIEDRFAPDGYETSSMGPSIDLAFVADALEGSG